MAYRHGHDDGGRVVDPRDVLWIIVVLAGGIIAFLVGRATTPRVKVESDTVLTETNRRRLVEEMAAVVNTSLPLMLNKAVEDAAPIYDPGEWHASRSILEPRSRPVRRRSTDG